MRDILKRKLVQHGHSTLVVSLPSKWASKNKLKKGDSIYFKDKGKSLEILNDVSLSKEKLSFDISNLDRTSLINFIIAAYRRGFDQIVLTFEKPEIVHNRTKIKLNVYDVAEFAITERLMGLEITHHDERSITIKEISKPSSEDFDDVMRRILILIVEMSKQLMEGMVKNEHMILKSIEKKHDNITKLISYCLRMISKFEYVEQEKSNSIFHILCQLDKIVDILKYVARDQIVYNKTIKRETRLIIDQIHNSILLFNLLYYNLDSEVISSLDKNRNDVKTAIWSNIDRLPELEVRMISILSQVQELIMDLTLYRMALEM